MSVRTNAGFLDAVPIGAGFDWFSDTAPDNFMFCRGQELSRTEYSDLYKIIGTTYGIGNGTTTFNLPDFRDRTGVGKGTSNKFNKLGNKTGSINYTLTANNIPSHKHGLGVTIGEGKDDAPTNTGVDGTHNDSQSPGLVNNYADGGSVRIYDGGTRKIINRIKTIFTNNTGSNAAFDIVQPSLVVNKIIKVK